MNSDPFKQYLCQEYSPLLFWFYSLMCLFMTLFRALCTHFYRSIILIARHQVVVNLCNPSDKKICSSPTRLVQDIAAIVLVTSSDLHSLERVPNSQHHLHDLYCAKPFYSHGIISVNSKKKLAGADTKQKVSFIKQNKTKHHYIAPKTQNLIFK